MTVAVQSSQVHKNYVAGAWVEGAKVADDINPSDTNDVVGRFTHGDAAQTNVAVKAAQIVNDGLAEYVAGKPDRFVACGSVPMPDGNAAAAELERGMKQLGFKGAQILTNVAGRELSDPAFAPFWKKAEELGALIVIHPNGFTEAQRLERFYFNNVIGNPLETTVAASHLIFDGVLERHPKLKVVLPHAGGYLAHYWARMDHAWRARPDCRTVLKKKPTESLEKFYFDTITFDRTMLRQLVQRYGADHVLLGTDHPFELGDPAPLDTVAALGLDREATRAILWDNAAGLLGVGVRP